jgi:hypothetical protein
VPTPLSKIPVVGPVADVATDLVAGVAKLPAAAADKAVTQVRSGVSLGRLAVEGTARGLVQKVSGRGAPAAPAAAKAAAPSAPPAPAAAPAPAPAAPTGEPVTDIDAGAADVQVDATPADVAAAKKPAKKAPAKKAPAKKTAAKKAPAKKAPAKKSPDEVPLKSEPTPASAAPPVPEGPEQLGQLGDDRTEPLLDPSTAKQVASEHEMLQQGSES